MVTRVLCPEVCHGMMSSMSAQCISSIKHLNIESSMQRLATNIASPIEEQGVPSTHTWHGIVFRQKAEACPFLLVSRRVLQQGAIMEGRTFLC